MGKKHILPIVILAVALSAFFLFRPQKQFNKIEFERTFDRATQLLRAEKLDDAIVLFKKVIQQDPTCAVAYFNQGRAYAKQEQYEHALNNFKTVLQLQPEAEYAQLVHFQIAQLHIKQEQFEDALYYLDKAIERNPEYSDAYLQRGVVHQNLGKLSEAFDDLKRVEQGDALANRFVDLGVAFRNVDDFNMALAAYEQALKMKPQDPLCHCFVADMLNILGNEELRHEGKVEKVERALSLYKKACELDDTCYSATLNAGVILGNEFGKTKESMSFFNRALKIDSDSAEAQFCLGTAYLKLGDFDRGCVLYESRYKWDKAFLPGWMDQYKSIPQWDGSDLQGKTILLLSEQALGDTFQFVRFAKKIKQRGGNAIVAVQKPLKEIIELCPYIDQVVILGEQGPKADVQILLMSMPYILKTQVDTIPSKPYLYARDDLVMKWHKQLEQDKKVKIGICWEGETSHDVGHYWGNTKKITFQRPTRSILLKALAPLMSIENISFYSVQKIPDYDQFHELTDEMKMKIFIQDFDESNGRFMDTAAVMKNLDLVITIDTSIAHLAGGLGVPTWLLLPYASEWRWLENRSDSPWYPTMRLFRQPKLGDWDSVIQEVIAALNPLIEKKERVTYRANAS